MLLEDGCREAIDKFWHITTQNRTLDLYYDPDVIINRCWMRGWYCKKTMTRDI